MKYVFSALYVLGTAIVLLNMYLLITTGWTWTPAIKIVIALIFLYANYRFMKEAYKAKENRDADRQNNKPDTNDNKIAQ